jgi:hypothetical protein
MCCLKSCRWRRSSKGTVIAEALDEALAKIGLTDACSSADLAVTFACNGDIARRDLLVDAIRDPRAERGG